MNLSTLDKNMSLTDIFAILGNSATAIFASKLSPEMKMKRLIENAARKSEDSRIAARDARMEAVRLFDPKTVAKEPLELLKEKEQVYIMAGKDRTVKIQKALAAMGLDPALKGEELDAACAQNDDLKKLVQQRSQLSLDLAAFRAGELGMTQQNYDTAWETYQTTIQTYAGYEAALKTLRDQGPNIIRAIKAKEALLAQKDAAHAAQAGLSHEPDPNRLMAELRGEFDSISASVRSDEAVDNDLDGLKPVTSDDILAEFDHANANAATLAEFDVPIVK